MVVRRTEIVIILIIVMHLLLGVHYLMLVGCLNISRFRRHLGLHMRKTAINERHGIVVVDHL
jgi:hypothetical protein